jgi:MoaA/NifB/PqqE/SkfB family radical SAM enzyme
MSGTTIRREQADRIHYLHVEISTLCNAACPCCPRFETNTPLTPSSLTLGYIDIKTFKEWFPVSIMKRVKYLNFCGNHGDPATNPDLPEILEYCGQFENIFKIEFHTNGGMKNPAFWKKVATAANNSKTTEVRAVFSVDGLKDTNHIYRRNVKWDKLIKNIEAYQSTLTRKENTVLEFLVFKHNEHQIDEAKIFFAGLNLQPMFKAPINLDDGENITPVPVQNNEGGIQYWIYPTDVSDYKPSYIKDNAKVIKESTEPFGEGFKDGGLTDQDRETIKIADNTKIIPRCNQNDLYVEVDGFVHQCCFTAVAFYRARAEYLAGNYVPVASRQLIGSMEAVGFDKFSLASNTLENIIKNKVLKNLYNDSWENKVSEGKKITCAQNCGKVNSLDTLFPDKNKNNKTSYRRSTNVI